MIGSAVAGGGRVWVSYNPSFGGNSVDLNQDQLELYDSENFYYQKIKNKEYQQIDKDTGEVKHLKFDFGSFNIISSGDILLTIHKKKVLRRMAMK